jgi:hypothetical protein
LLPVAIPIHLQKWGNEMSKNRAELGKMVGDAFVAYFEAENQKRNEESRKFYEELAKKDHALIAQFESKLVGAPEEIKTAYLPVLKRMKANADKLTKMGTAKPTKKKKGK